MALHCEAANAVLFFFYFSEEFNLIFVREERTLACIKTPRRDTNGGGGGGDDEVASTSEPRSLTSTRDKEIGKAASAGGEDKYPERRFNHGGVTDVPRRYIW